MIAAPEYDQWRAQNFHRNLEGQWVDRDGNVYTEVRLREMHASLAPTVRFPFVRLVEASGVVAGEANGSWQEYERPWSGTGPIEPACRLGSKRTQRDQQPRS